MKCCNHGHKSFVCEQSGDENWNVGWDDDHDRYIGPRRKLLEENSPSSVDVSTKVEAVNDAENDAESELEEEAKSLEKEASMEVSEKMDEAKKKERG